MKIKTNGHARPLVSHMNLPQEARADFDYVTPDEAWDERFFEYRGSWYDAHEFDRVGQGFGAEALIQSEGQLRNWVGVQPESAFSAVLIRYPFEWDGVTVDYESVVVGYAHW